MDGGFERDERTEDYRVTLRGDAIGRGATVKILRTLMAMLREIFDEAAFVRYCAREQVKPSRISYARFVREAKAPPVRCC